MPWDIVGAMDQADATRQAADKQSNAQILINQENTAWAKQQQGAGGAPVYMPLGESDFENTMRQQAKDVYNATYVDPNTQLKQYQGIANTFTPMMNKTYGDIASGQWGKNVQSSFAPVATARTNAARVSHDAMVQSISDRLNSLSAGARASGYSSTGAPAQRMLLGATFAGNRDAASALAAANTQNASDVFGLDQANRQLTLNTAQQAPQIAMSMANMYQMPQMAMTQAYLNRVNTMAPFHVQRGTPTPMLTAPTFTATTTPMAAGMSAASGSIGQLYNAYKQNQQQSQLNTWLQQQNGGGGGASWMTAPAATQWGEGAWAPAADAGASMGADIAAYA